MSCLPNDSASYFFRALFSPDCVATPSANPRTLAPPPQPLYRSPPLQLSDASAPADSLHSASSVGRPVSLSRAQHEPVRRPVDEPARSEHELEGEVGAADGAGVARSREHHHGRAGQLRPLLPREPRAHRPARRQGDEGRAAEPWDVCRTGLEPRTRRRQAGLLLTRVHRALDRPWTVEDLSPGALEPFAASKVFPGGDPNPNPSSDPNPDPNPNPNPDPNPDPNLGLPGRRRGQRHHGHGPR